MTAANSAHSQSNYCAQHISGGTGNRCFETLGEAEAFLRTEPNPAIGLQLLEPSGTTPLLGNRIQINYSIRPRKYESFFGDWYFAYNYAGGPTANCGARVPLSSTVAYGCADEVAVAADLLSVYPYYGLNIAGWTGAYGPMPPSSWTPIGIDAATGRSYVRVDYPVRRVLNIANGSVSYGSEPINRFDFFSCPRFLVGIAPQPGWSLWPVVCGGLPSANITTSSGQYGSCTRDGNPCIAATGNKEYRETDFEWEGLPFRRAYNSIRDLPLLSGMGNNWAHSYSDRLIMRSGLSSNMLWIRSDGYFELMYEAAPNVFTSKNELGVMMFREPDATAVAQGRWRLTQPGGRTMWFNEAGRLIRIVDGSKTILLDYCAPADLAIGNCLSAESLVRATSSTGRQLEFEYDIVNISTGSQTGDVFQAVMMTRIRANGFLIAQYGYDAQGRQVASNFGNATLLQGRKYVYAEAANLCVDGAGAAISGCNPAHFSYHLTGVIDEASARHAIYTYGAAGRVTRSEHAGGAGRVSLTYQPGGSVDVTLPLGTRKSYGFVGSYFRKPSSTVLSAPSSGNVLSTTSRTFPDTRMTSETSSTGSRTNYVYDSFHETSRTRGLNAAGATQPETQTIETDWHADLNVPIEQRTYSPANTLVARSTWTYNARGQVLASTEHDPTSSAKRTTTTTYCEDADVTAGRCPIVGLVTSVNGPRTDIDDITTYEYYSGTSFVSTDPDAGGHTTGDLMRMTDPTGRITSFGLYNRLGQVMEATDPNGVVTAYTYDARQRLTSTSVGGQTTNQEYWPTGLLKKVTQPDGVSFVQYTYDDAHRLRVVQDNLGNSITYTLDNMGNRRAEDVVDPGNALRRQLTRNIDALGRVEQVTGRQ